MDVAVVGDTEEVPLAERTEWLRMGEGTLDERLRGGGGGDRRHPRTHDRCLARAHRSRAQRRGSGTVARRDGSRPASRLGHGIEVVLDHPVDAVVADLLWAFLGPEMYVKLTVDAKMSRAQYERALIDAMVAIGGIERAPSTRRRRNG